MERRAYPSDISDDEWVFVALYLPAPSLCVLLIPALYSNPGKGAILIAIGGFCHCLGRIWLPADTLILMHRTQGTDLFIPAQWVADGTVKRETRSARFEP